MNIFIDQAGYLPDMEKKAAVTAPAKGFGVVSESGEVKFSGELLRFGYDECSGDEVYIADFSALRECGRYSLLLDSGESSLCFDISERAYSPCFDAVTKAFFFLRCGCGLDEKHAGEFKHGKCHTERALLWDDRSVSLDVTGGWHDAGDYGRYSTAAACALAHLLYAYRLYPETFKKQSLNIPESGGALPDILAECKIELDWLMKMQREDGAVYHKATTKGHAGFVMPEEDRAQMFVLPPSSMATADFAAVCALAAGIYGDFDREYADRLISASLKSYEWLEANPDYLFENRAECTTGGYGERNDRDNRFWAAAELFALTGEEKYHEKFKSLLNEDFSRVSLGYADMGGIGALAYILGGRGEERLRAELKQGFISEAERLARISDSCGYGAALLPVHYSWGSNMTLLKHGMIFLLADGFEGKNRFERYAAAQLHYLLGVNATGCSYVSGIGERAINYPHLRPAYADGVERCIPGMVSGGANRSRNDPDARRLIPEGTPPMKCFIDDYRCFSLNEITIYWNSPAVFVLAHFCGE